MFSGGGARSVEASISCGSDRGPCGAGAMSLAAATLEPLVVFLFFFAFLGTLDETTWAYEGRGLRQSGSRLHEMKGEGSGYLPFRNTLASHESGHFAV